MSEKGGDQGAETHHHEERTPGDTGPMPELRDEGISHRQSVDSAGVQSEALSARGGGPVNTLELSGKQTFRGSSPRAARFGLSAQTQVLDGTGSLWYLSAGQG